MPGRPAVTALSGQGVRAGRVAAQAPSPAGGWSGLLLGRMSVLPAVLAGCYLVVALPLLCAGHLRPALTLPCWLALSIPVGWFAWTRTPALETPRWAAIATLAVAVAFGVLAVVSHADYVLVRRDAGAYSQIGFWLAEHGRIPISAHSAAFGGPDPLLRFGSAAFYPDGGSVVPQFMSGWPMALAAGYWAHGWTGLLALPGVVGAFAVLAIAGLAARLIGPGWAPLAALATGVCWPVLHFSQATYSEPLALLLLFGGLAMLVDVVAGSPVAGARAGFAAGTGRRGVAGLAVLAGAVLGLTLLVRIDAGRELTLLVPVVGWLFARRRPEATPVVLGLGFGAALGVLDAGVLSRPYIAHLADSVIPLAGLFGVSVCATATVVLLLRTRTEPLAQAAWWRPVPRLGAALVALASVFLIVRPWAQTVRDTGQDQDVIDYVASIQRANSVPVDGARTYAESSLHWVAWYLGWPLLAVGLLGGVALTWRTLAGREVRWVAPLAVILGSTMLTLYRPGITPDHPWADRRLVPVVLPGVILLAVWGLRIGAGAVAGWARTRAVRSDPARAGRRARALTLAFGLVAFTVPAGITAAPLVGHGTEIGEVRAIELACAAFRPGDVVLLLNGQTEWTQALRSGCQVPTAAVTPSALSSQGDSPTLTQIDYLVSRIRQAGGQPVLAAGESADPIAAYGATPLKVLQLDTNEDAQVLQGAPVGEQVLQLNLWIARLAPGG